MNNESELIESLNAAPEPTIKPGTLLKQKRESLNLSIQQVADKLRLRSTLIQSIEDNDFNIDKVKTFTRGYVRSYARVVGIEESVILASYDAYYGIEPQELDMKSFSRQTKRDRHNSRINYITFGIVLIVIGISSLWWYQNQSKDSFAAGSLGSEVSDTSSTSDSDQGFATVSELSQDASDSVADQTSDTSNGDEQSPASEGTDVTTDDGSSDSHHTSDRADANLTPEETNRAEPTKPAETSSAIKSEPETSPITQTRQENISAMITMTFIHECWIQVKDATGKTLSIGLKKPGQIVSLDGQAPFKVILGAPESVSMTFASEPVDLSRYTSGKVARFTLSR
jgi:cytoskeleton protein RodZ